MDLFLEIGLARTPKYPLMYDTHALDTSQLITVPSFPAAILLHCRSRMTYPYKYGGTARSLDRNPLKVGRHIKLFGHVLFAFGSSTSRMLDATSVDVILEQHASAAYPAPM